MRRQKAFTLVELLVVIGIIALLISILLPALNRVRMQAQQVECSANLRSVGQFYAMYASAFKGHYPTGNSAGNFPFGSFQGGLIGGTPGNYSGNGPVAIYNTRMAKSAKVFYCPTLERQGDDAATFKYGNLVNAGYGRFWEKPADYVNTYTSYIFWVNYPGTNGGSWFGDLDVKPTNWPYMKTGFMRTITARNARSNGSSVLASDSMVFDTNQRYILQNNHTTKRLTNNVTETGAIQRVLFYGGNVLYNDGHVIWKSADQAEPMMRFNVNNNGTMLYYF